MTCPYCKRKFAGGYLCAPCVRELVAEGRYAEMMDSYYPLKKEKLCTSKANKSIN